MTGGVDEEVEEDKVDEEEDEEDEEEDNEEWDVIQGASGCRENQS